MPLLSGSASVTRLSASLHGEPAFDELGFRNLDPESEIRETIGFVPFSPGSDYRLAGGRWAFRIRIDRRAPDPFAVRERLGQLLAAEREELGADRVPRQKVKALKQLAELELLRDSSPRTRIVEAVIDQGTLYLGSAADAVIGKVVQFLRKADIICDFKAPWIDRGQEHLEGEFLQVNAPGQSLWGSRFARELVGDQELPTEPVDGYCKLQTADARIILSGAILPELLRHLEEEAEVLSLKLIGPSGPFRLATTSFRVSSLSLPPSREIHWQDRLEDRLECLLACFELLDQKYDELLKSSRKRGRGKIISFDQEAQEA